MARTVLVTGGTGFVGANVVLRLLEDGHRVVLLVRSDYSAWRIEGFASDVQLVEADLGDAEGVARLVGRIAPEWVFHLAAYGAYPFQTDLQQMIRTNLYGTVNLVQAAVAAGVGAMVNAGSSSEYGYQRAAPGEGTFVEPNSHYAWSKVSATQFCRLTAQRTGLPITTLRIYSAYGPFEEPTRLMPALVASGLRGMWPRLADPAIARDYVHVADVADAFVRAAADDRPGRDPGPVYNVGTGTQSSLADVVAVAGRRLPIAVEPVWGTMANRSWDTDVWVADNRRICAELGWRPRYGFEAGFGAFVDWCLAHPAVVQRYAAALPVVAGAGEGRTA